MAVAVAKGDGGIAAGEGGMSEGAGASRYCARCGESVHDFVGREEEAAPGVCGRIGRLAGAALAVAVAGGMVAAGANAIGSADASNVPRDAGPAVDASVDAEPPLMGKLVFAADDDEGS